MFASLINSQYWYFGEAVVTVAAGAFAVWRVIHNILKNSISDRLNEIKAQTVPNGGGSLRDAVDRIEKKLDTTIRELDRHLGYHEAIEKVSPPNN